MSTGRKGINRRTFLQGAGAAATLAATGFPAIAQQRTKLRVGYVNTLAVNGQIWTGVHRGHWAKEGLELETTMFSTGLELFNAMIGGSLDMLSTGAAVGSSTKLRPSSSGDSSRAIRPGSSAAFCTPSAYSRSWKSTEPAVILAA